MPSNIEERVVQMRFDNAQFEKGAAQSLRTLDKLESVLDQLGTGGGLDKIGSALDILQRRFSNFGIAGAAAISHVTTQVVDLAEKLLTAIPRQIISGGKTRALNLEQARFQIEGLGKSWDEMYKAMDYAVADTAYGLDEAAKAAAQFAASGVSYEQAADGLSDMHKALRAISGVAGMTNSSYDDIAHIFTGIAGTGKVMTQDLRMLEGRGLNVAAKLAEVLRDGPGNIQYTEEQIRKMVSKGEIDFLTFAKAMDSAFGDHAKKANETFTGSLANMKAALSRIGADFATPIHKGAIDIFNAFRNTFNRVRKITRPFAEGNFTKWAEKISTAISKWAETIDFSWLEGLIYVLDNADFSWIVNAIDKLTELNKGLQSLFYYQQDINDEGKIHPYVDTDALKCVKNLKRLFMGLQSAGRILLTVFSSIGQGISTAFGEKTLNLFDNLLATLGNIGGWLTKNEDKFKSGAIEKISVAFKKLVQVLSPVSRIVKASVDLLVIGFTALFGKIKGQSGPFVSAFSTVFNWTVKVAEKLSDWLELVRDAVRENGSFAAGLDTISGKFKLVHDFVNRVTSAVGGFLHNLLHLEEGETIWGKLSEKFQSAGAKISEVFDSIRETLSETFGGGSGASVVKAAGAILTVFLGYRKLEKIKWAFGRFGRTFSVVKDGLAGLWKQVGTLANLPDKISTVLSRTSGALRAFTDSQNAEAILKIGAAVLTLSIGLAILAAINVDHLAPALGAVAAILGMLVAAFAAINYIMRPSKLFKEAKAWSTIFKGIGNSINKYIQAKAIQEIAKAMMFLGVSVLALSAAVWVLSKVEPDRLWSSVGAVITVFAAIVVALIAISKMAKPADMISFGVAMIGVAAGLLVLVAALGLLSLVPVDRLKTAGITLAIGLAAMTAALLLLSGTIKSINAVKMLAAGVAMVMIASALLILVAALVVVALIPTDALIKAGIAIGAFLVGMVVAVGVLSALGPKALVGAGALLLAGLALVAVGIAFTVASIGLLILAAALQLMPPAGKILKTAGALAVLGIALLVMAPAMLILGFAGLGMVAAGIGLVLLAAALQVMPSASKILKMAGALSVLSLALILLAPAMLLLGIGGLLLRLAGDAFLKLVPLATALTMLDGVNLLAIGGGLLLVGVALGALGVAGLLLGLGSLGLMAGVTSLGVLAAALPKLAEGFHAMDDVEWGSIGKGIAVLAGGSFALFLANVATLGGIADPSSVLIGLGSTLPVFAEGLHSLDDVPWESIGKGIVIFVEAAVGALAANIATLGGLADPTGPLANLGQTLPVLASGLHSLDGVTWDEIGTGFVILSEAIAALLATNIATMGGIFDPTGPIYNLGAVMPMLADGIGAFDGVTGNSVELAFAALATGVGALLGLDIATFGGLVDPANGALSSFAAEMPALAAGFKSFKDVDGGAVATAFAALAGGITAIIGTNIATFGGIFDPNTGALTGLGLALPTLAAGLHSLDDITWDTIGTAFGVFTTGVGSILGLSFANLFGEGGTNQLASFGDALIPLSTGLKALENITWGSIGKAFTTLATGIGPLLLANFGNAEKFLAVGQGFEAIAVAIGKFPEDAGQRMKDFVTAIKNNEGDVVAVVGELLVLITTTIDSHKPKVSASMASLVVAMSTTFTNYKGNWTILGTNVSVGIANGIARGTPYVSSAMSGLVKAGISSFTSGFKIHSPSHLMEMMSEYIPMGAGRGIQNGSHYITDGMIVAFSPALAYLNTILNSDYDFQPTIHPVVDMTDAVSGANSIRDMLAAVNPQSVWGGVSGVNAINVDGAAIDYRVQNDGVVNEIRSLADRMDALSEAITNMQIILDTGVLVGETTAAFDNQLGVLAMRKGRGI